MTPKQRETLDTLAKWTNVAIATDEGNLVYAAEATEYDWYFSGIVLPNGNLSESRNVTLHDWSKVAEICEYESL